MTEVNKKLTKIKNALKLEMESKLLDQNDLRMIGYGHLYEQHPFYKIGHYYEKFMKGEAPKVGWAIDSDFEAYYLDGDGNELEKVVVPKPNKKWWWKRLLLP